jgi:DNA-binding NarL/FixJ family response regulator
MTRNTKPNGEHRARVLIVDDHPAVREGLGFRIAGQPDMEVCGEAADVVGALQQVAALNPDVAVIDIALKDGSGIDLMKRIKARNDSVRVLAMSMYDESLYAERALRAGALGYVNKAHATDKIIEGIRRVLEGKVYLSEQMVEKVLTRSVGDTPGQLRKSDMETLSDREMQVFRMMGGGVGTHEIADKMHLSLKTVETYRARIKEKLGLKNSAELIQRAVLWTMENG